MKRITALLLATVLCIGLCACGGDSKDKKPAVGSSSSATAANRLPEVAPEKPQYTEVGENGSRTDDEVGFQLDLPEIGETIAVFETNMGNIYMRLFPESAPITVTNFKGLIDAGYYDGLIFHRVIKDFMIQGGDPDGNGTGGTSVWGGKFEDEFNANLLNIRGSVAMANSGTATNGSQFFINQNSTPVNKVYYDYKTLYEQYVKNYGEQIKAEYEQYKSQLSDKYADAEAYMKDTIDYNIAKSSILGDTVSDEAWELYAKVGGNIHLDGAFKGGYGGHTVFAQVFAGMDIVDSIASVSVDSNSKPTTDVVINRAYTVAVDESILALADSTEEPEK